MSRLSLSSLIDKSLSMPSAAALLALAGFGALVFAAILQYAFNVLPCDLCLRQRVPYGVVGVLSLIALFWKPYGKQTTVLLGLCALAFLVGAGYGVFHTGVEQHWWAELSTCAATPLPGASLEDLRQALLKTESPRCDDITWSLFGLSLANWNVLASLALALFTALAARKAWRSR